jgi:hypothetical protein
MQQASLNTMIVSHSQRTREIQGRTTRVLLFAGNNFVASNARGAQANQACTRTATAPLFRLERGLSKYKTLIRARNHAGRRRSGPHCWNGHLGRECPTRFQDLSIFGISFSLRTFKSDLFLTYGELPSGCQHSVVTFRTCELVRRTLA